MKVGPLCVRNIGGVTEFDRSQYITIHEGNDSSRLQGFYPYMEKELDIRYGRDGGKITGSARPIKSSAADPDMPDVEQIKKRGAESCKRKMRPGADPGQVRETILCTHPEKLHATPHNEFAEWGRLACVVLQVNRLEQL